MSKKNNKSIQTKIQKKPFPKAFCLVTAFFALYFCLTLARATYETPIMDDNMAEFLAVMSNWFVQLAKPWGIFMVWRMSWEYAWLVIFLYLIILGATYSNYLRNMHVYKGKEKGTAKWGDIDKFVRDYAYPPGEDGFSDPPEDVNDFGNLILSKNLRLTLNTRIKGVNNNVFVEGPPGSGKSRNLGRPNFLQHNTSFVITDPSGELLKDTGYSFMNDGYEVKAFNLSDMQHSMCYNPFRYINSDSEIPVLVDCLIKNTNDKENKGGDQFFSKAETQLLTALFYYVHYREPKEKQNMRRIVELLNMIKVDENNPNAKSKLDALFEIYEKDDPTATGVKAYKGFKSGTGKTLKSIVISANVRMTPFMINDVCNLTNTDNLELETFGDNKQVLFIITPTETQQYNFLAAMLYTQLFQLLYHKGSVINPNRFILKYNNSSPIQSEVFNTRAERETVKNNFLSTIETYKKATIKEVEREGQTPDEISSIGKYRYSIILPDGKTVKIFEHKRQAEYFLKCIKHGTVSMGRVEMPSNIHFFLDEFANIGTIPEFDQKLSTMRKFGIFCTIIVQAIGQLKNMYKDNWGTIIGDCATQIYLGAGAIEDAEHISKMLGKATQEVTNISRSYGSKGNYSKSRNKDSIDLLTPDEILRLDSKKCLVFIQSYKDPFIDYKYDVMDHIRANELADNNPDFTFDYKAYFKVKSEAISVTTTLYQPSRQEIQNKTKELNGSEKTQEASPVGNQRDLLDMLYNIPTTEASLSEELLKGNNVELDRIAKSINKNYKNYIPVDIDSGIKDGEILTMDDDGSPF